MIGNALALVFGVPLGTVLGTALGWRWAFVVLAVALGGLALAVLRVLPRQAPARSTPRTPVMTGIRRPAVLSMATVIALLALGHFTLYTYVSPLLLHKRRRPRRRRSRALRLRLRRAARSGGRWRGRRPPTRNGRSRWTSSCWV